MKPLTLAPLQPDGHPACMTFAWATNRGQHSRSAGYRYAIATITVPIKRYSCAHTVGHGFSKWHTHTNQPGDRCRVYGAFADGRVIVELPGGGYARLGTADVIVCDVSELTDEESSYLSGLPSKSVVVDGEIIA